eukprot:scaffold3151_cov385-Prasinococcus_capsulatus_cf.AAC.4
MTRFTLFRSHAVGKSTRFAHGESLVVSRRRLGVVDLPLFPNPCIGTEEGRPSALQGQASEIPSERKPLDYGL